MHVAYIGFYTAELHRSIAVPAIQLRDGTPEEDHDMALS
jgi:hypothetical protein